MSSLSWSDAVDSADDDLHTDPMETASAHVSYSDAAHEPDECSSIPDDDLNVIDEHTSALLGCRPPLSRSTF